jgi:RNA polymerase sigma-70 factor (ECF subfamily)
VVESDREFGSLLLSARGGSPEALGRALNACRRYLLLVAEKELDPGLKPKGSASDLVQETFLEAQRDFGRFHGTTEAELLAWLRRLLLNNLANFTRGFRQTGKRAVDREVGLDGAVGAADGLTPSGHALEREQAAELQDALGRLPEDYRRVITLRYLEERTFEEIGPLMERSPDAARKLWARAMERLRDEWQGSRPALGPGG